MNNSVNDNINLGNVQFQSGHFDEAIVYYGKAIITQPRSCSRLLPSGMCDDYGLKRDDYDAIAYYDKAIELNPDFADAYFKRGCVNAELMNYCLAIPDFDKAIELNPDFADAYFHRGCAKGSLEQIADALADFNTVIHLNPDCVKAYLSRALVKFGLKCTTEAMQDLQTALKPAEQTVADIKRRISKLQ